MTRLWLLLCILAVSGCATYKPVPEGYKGKTTYLTDSLVSEDATKAQAFAVIGINGNAVPNSFSDSAAASFGRGFSLNAFRRSREIPVLPMKLTLRGSI